MERRIEEKKEEIEKLYILDDTFGLEDEEINRRQELTGDVMLESSWNESQLLQKPKLKWLQQGDANSSFFHNWVKSRHKRNEIVGLWNNGTWVESVQGVKQLAHYHFKRQFEAVEENSAYFSETLFRNHVGLTNNDCVYGINVSDTEMVGAAGVLGCEFGSGSVDYLGMKVGTNHHKKETWEWLLEKIKYRLSRWDGRNISMGGRATFIQSVLAAMPIYALSFYILPKNAISEIQRVQRSFLWGGDEKSSKIPWVSWGAVCRGKTEGGLGREVDLEVPCGGYGGLEWLNNVNNLSGGSRSGSGWWKDISNLYWGKRGEEGWKADFYKEVGEGENTLFWQDSWIDRECLKIKFNRLYKLSEQNEALISEMGFWENGKWVWDFICGQEQTKDRDDGEMEVET
ncbi:hypothetical protein ACS0TY_021147 [Phlomoides rotata]